MTHVPAEDRLRRHIEATLQQIDDLRAAGGERDTTLAALRSSLNPRSGQLGNANNWRGSGDLKEARETVRRVIEDLCDTLAALRAQALAEALPLFVRFVMEETEARAADGRLVFDDLIRGVRNVLREQAGARIQLRDRFDTILIDEFQDTDPLQAEIALHFARPPGGGEPESGRLFLVGDPKQSIYRFRHADMAMYARVSDLIKGAGGREIDLSLNRRSQPGIIEWVNTIFEKVIGPGVFPEIQPPYRKLHAYRDDALAGAPVSRFGGALAMTAAEVRQIEARHIAAYCRKVVADGWQVVDRDKGPRAARYGDIAVLLPARTILQSLERALTGENIPYRVEGGSLVYATQEVRDLINCLTAIDDPSDDVAVVAALRSPAYACSDVDLLQHRREGGSFNYLSPGVDALSGPVADGLRSLRDWHHRRAEMTLAALVESFIADRRLVEIGLIDSGSRNAFRRARFMVEQARQFEKGGPESLRSFVEWLERRANEAILDSEGAGLDDDEDAVRVLTIHAAKGLEFPIVFLGGLGAAPYVPAPVFGHDREDGQIAVQIGSAGRGAQFQLGPVDAVHLHEREHADAERSRLLYVAATRARDHLIVSLYHKDGSRECAAVKLIDCGAIDAAAPMPPVDLAAGTAVEPFAGLEIDDAGDEESFETERTALVSRAKMQRYTSATALGRDAKGEREDETEPWSRGRAGTHLGRAVHAALQTLAWDADDEEIAAVARAQTVAEAVPNLADEAANLIRVALRSDVARRALEGKRALREVPFALPRDGLILEGYADLVIEAEDGSLEIVDWKTDHVSESAVEARAVDYELQAGVYVLGLEAATGRTVSRVTYFFVTPGREYGMPSPAQLAQAANERLATASL